MWIWGWRCIRCFRKMIPVAPSVQPVHAQPALYPPPTPQYQPKKNSSALIGIIAAAVLITVLAAVVVFVLFFGDIVHRRVYTVIEPQGTELAVDQEATIVYMKDSDGEGIMNLDQRTFYFKDKGSSSCEDLSDFVTFDGWTIFNLFVIYLLPPSDAEKLSTKTVSGRECQVYESYHDLRLDGESITLHLLHCVRDRFVIETVVSNDGDQVIVTYSKHNKLQKSSSLFNVDDICTSFANSPSPTVVSTEQSTLSKEHQFPWRYHSHLLSNLLKNHSHQ
ncbi:hypothetical protein GEMRC1_003226 [Eukaryota sp. GEM-RC1]